MKRSPVGVHDDDLYKMLMYARKIQKISRRKLSRMIGTSDTVVRFMEQGKYNPTMAFLDRYARCLGVRIEFNVLIRQTSELSEEE